MNEEYEQTEVMIALKYGSVQELFEQWLLDRVDPTTPELVMLYNHKEKYQLKVTAELLENCNYTKYRNFTFAKTYVQNA